MTTAPDNQTAPASMDWAAELAAQLSWHWDNQLRPRLDGLGDEEYFWRPVPQAWTVHRPGEGDRTLEVGTGEYVVDYTYPEPVPAPVTSIAWQIGHLLVGVLGMRNATYFGGPEMDYEGYDYPGTAAEALDRLDAGYRIWIGGVRDLGDEQLRARCAEPGHEQESMAGLVLHIHRETIHHGAMISTLRDLWAWRTQ